MQTPRLDHVLTYLDGTSLAEQLERYRAAGFAVIERTIQHEPGLRNGYFFAGPEYFELCWVEDEARFCQGGHPLAGSAYRQARRPYALGLIHEDVRKLHAAWTARALSPGQLKEEAPPDEPRDAGPRWRFLFIADSLTPGARCFAVTYLRRKPGDPVEVRIPPNTTYALEGVTFVAQDPGERAQRWRDLFSPDAPLTLEHEAHRVSLGPHHLTWLAPKMYQEWYGQTWRLAPHAAGELALFHLLATDLGRAAAVLSSAGRTVERRVAPGTALPLLLVHPDPHDGLTFAITERPVEAWRQERAARTGERLEILPPE